MKLYDTPQAANARRMRMSLAEKGLDVPREEINLVEEGAKMRAFTVLNSMQAVPVLHPAGLTQPAPRSDRSVNPPSPSAYK